MRFVEETERQVPGIFGPYGAYFQAYGLMNTAFAARSFVGPMYAGFFRAHFGWSAMSPAMSALSLAMMISVLLVTGENLHTTEEADPNNGDMENED